MLKCFISKLSLFFFTEAFRNISSYFAKTNIIFEDFQIDWEKFTLIMVIKKKNRWWNKTFHDKEI